MKRKSFDEIPETWLDRCSGDGHKRITDNDGNKRYADTQQIVQEEGYRPCAKCGEFPHENGDDACLHNLGRVINACCGHGVEEGYIQFDDNTHISGIFTVVNMDKEKIIDIQDYYKKTIKEYKRKVDIYNNLIKKYENKLNEIGLL